MSPFATISAEVVDVRGPIDEQEGTTTAAGVGESEDGRHDIEGSCLYDGRELSTGETYQEPVRGTRSGGIGTPIQGKRIEPKS